MKTKILYFAFVLFLALSVSCTTTTVRRITAYAGGGQGELWLVIKKQSSTSTGFSRMYSAPTYEVYRCTPQNRCKKIDEIETVKVRSGAFLHNGKKPPAALTKKGIVIPFKRVR